MTIFQGDNTQAFGGNFVNITFTYHAVDGTELPLPPISKAEVRVGSIVKTYENPTSPLKVNFTEAESAKLGETNVMYLALYDETGKKKTACGRLVFAANMRRV